MKKICQLSAASGGQSGRRTIGTNVPAGGPTGELASEVAEGEAQRWSSRKRTAKTPYKEKEAAPFDERTLLDPRFQEKDWSRYEEPTGSEQEMASAAAKIVAHEYGDGPMATDSCSSGIKGISRHRGKWQAKCSLGGGCESHVVTFDSVLEACAFYYQSRVGCKGRLGVRKVYGGGFLDAPSLMRPPDWVDTSDLEKARSIAKSFGSRLLEDKTFACGHPHVYREKNSYAVRLDGYLSYERIMTDFSSPVSAALAFSLSAEGRAIIAALDAWEELLTGDDKIDISCVKGSDAWRRLSDIQQHLRAGVHWVARQFFVTAEHWGEGDHAFVPADEADLDDLSRVGLRAIGWRVPGKTRKQDAGLHAVLNNSYHLAAAISDPKQREAACTTMPFTSIEFFYNNEMALSFCYNVVLRLSPISCGINACDNRIMALLGLVLGDFESAAFVSRFIRYGHGVYIDACSKINLDLTDFGTEVTNKAAAPQQLPAIAFLSIRDVVFHGRNVLITCPDLSLLGISIKRFSKLLAVTISSNVQDGLPFAPRGYNESLNAKALAVILYPMLRKSCAGASTTTEEEEEEEGEGDGEGEDGDAICDELFKGDAEGVMRSGVVNLTPVLLAHAVDLSGEAPLLDEGGSLILPFIPPRGPYCVESFPDKQPLVGRLPLQLRAFTEAELEAEPALLKALYAPPPLLRPRTRGAAASHSSATPTSGRTVPFLTNTDAAIEINELIGVNMLVKKKGVEGFAAAIAAAFDSIMNGPQEDLRNFTLEQRDNRGAKAVGERYAPSDLSPPQAPSWTAYAQKQAGALPAPTPPLERPPPNQARLTALISSESWAGFQRWTTWQRALKGLRRDSTQPGVQIEILNCIGLRPALTRLGVPPPPPPPPPAKPTKKRKQF